MLESLEAFREEVAGLFEHAPGDIAVVLHPRAAALTLAHPWLPLARIVAAPASRRYFAGWFTERDIHVLSSPALERRASKVPGLARGAPPLAASRVLAPRDRRQQSRPAAPVLARRVQALRALGLAVRGRRRVAVRPDPVPAPRDHAPAPRGRPPRVPALGPRRDAAGRHHLQHARARGRAGRRRGARHEPARRARGSRRAGWTSSGARWRAWSATGAPSSTRCQPPPESAGAAAGSDEAAHRGAAQARVLSVEQRAVRAADQLGGRVAGLPLGHPGRGRRGLPGGPESCRARRPIASTARRATSVAVASSASIAITANSSPP